MSKRLVKQSFDCKNIIDFKHVQSNVWFSLWSFKKLIIVDQWNGENNRM